ncbi:Transcriptional regulator, TetR family [Nostocoides japonicum T1-X7]|uniref:Transcriptional regulator, TetR family n=1 Tax=Nostocoides japonicum T1-X7 TaxID=1194083 RepID=A0A077LW53_9MICO|nr:TetR/AcrR family transcriptional regulator [Tetrasphaera japonica]CCH77057.1 Transcriptional regulator, TetR family [Tetrasphaera japonica T1-X7]
MKATEPAGTRRRMAVEDRRALVLDAAMRAFARGGYAGTSTDAVAREAGVSQPYVVRMFGTKLALFLDVFDLACTRIREVFERVIDEGPFDPEAEEDWTRLASAYGELVRDRDLLTVMMHGWAAGDVAEIAALGRTNMGRIFTTIMRTGCTPDQAEGFIAQGMLLNVMLSMRAPEHLDETPELAPLADCTFGDALSFLVAEADAG